MPLSLHPIIHIRRAPPDEAEEVVQYEVRGLPPRHEIVIGRFDGRWKIRRTVRGLAEPWSGDFETAQEAFASLGPEGSR